MRHSVDVEANEGIGHGPGLAADVGDLGIGDHGTRSHLRKSGLEKGAQVVCGEPPIGRVGYDGEQRQRRSKIGGSVQKRDHRGEGRSVVSDSTLAKTRQGNALQRGRMRGERGKQTLRHLHYYDAAQEAKMRFVEILPVFDEGIGGQRSIYAC